MEKNINADILKVKPQKKFQSQICKCITANNNNKYIISKKQVCQGVSKADNY